jgi:aminoglycoside phosphotransferase (APT) family kinase protein
MATVDAASAARRAQAKAKTEAANELLLPLSAPHGPRAKIGTCLLHYLSQWLGVRNLQFDQEPSPVPDGWVTHVYHFQLQRQAGLREEFRGPLTLRLFAGQEGLPAGRHEWAVQSFLRRQGYPVPAPLIWEESSNALGGPFLLMEQIPGPTLLARLLSRPWSVFRVARQMAGAQARLYRLPTEGFPPLQGSLLQRGLAVIQDAIVHHGLHVLTPGLVWLRAHRPPPPRTPSLVHLDFHPLNLIYRPHLPPAVLDWDTADVGDLHADVATTLMFLRCGPNVGNTRWRRSLIAGGRRILERSYLRACRRRLALDDTRLTYYRALAVLRRLAYCGRCAIAGPEAVGAKPSFLRHMPGDHFQVLCREFWHTTGIWIQLMESSCPIDAH